MEKFKSKAVLALTAMIFAIVAINTLQEEETHIPEVDISAITAVELEPQNTPDISKQIFDILNGYNKGTEERFSYIPEKSFIVAVLQDDAIFDSKLVMGNRVVYDSGDDIKMVVLKASQVHVSGAKNAILDNCSIQAFAELGLETAEIRSKRMQCMSLEGEMVDIPITLYAVNEDYEHGVPLTDCQKVNVQQDNGDIVPQCVTGSIASGTPVTFVVNKDVFVEVPIGVYTDELDKQLEHISSVFYESELHDYTVEFTIELLQYGKVSFMRKLRTVDGIPVTMSVYGSNGYRQTIKQKEIETEDEFDINRGTKVTLASGALYRDGFRLNVTPTAATKREISLDVSLEYQNLDTIDVFKHKKLKNLYELPSIYSNAKTVSNSIPWGSSIKIPVDNVGTFLVTARRKPGLELKD